MFHTTQVPDRSLPHISAFDGDRGEEDSREPRAA